MTSLLLILSNTADLHHRATERPGYGGRRRLYRGLLRASQGEGALISMELGGPHISISPAMLWSSNDACCARLKRGEGEEAAMSLRYSYGHIETLI